MVGLRVKGLMSHRPVWFSEGELNGSLKPLWNQHLWNTATDYAINILQSKQGFRLPVMSKYAKKFEEMSVQDIYSFLLKRTAITWYQR
jgi:hypothetical protein